MKVTTKMIISLVYLYDVLAEMKREQLTIDCYERLANEDVHYADAKTQAESRLRGMYKVLATLLHGRDIEKVDEWLELEDRELSSGDAMDWWDNH